MAIGLEMALRQRLKGKVLLIGAGNTLRGDDGAGPKVMALLEGKVQASLLDVGEVPESYVGSILSAKADTMVLIDAADWGGSPGDLAILEAEDLAGCSISTHQMPLDILFRYLKENSRADLFALGIQPAQIGLGAPMSPTVAESVQALANILQGML